MVEAYWFSCDVGMRFNEWEAGSASLGTSPVGQRRFSFLGVENYYREIEVGYSGRLGEWARSWTKGSRAGLGGVGDD